MLATWLGTFFSKAVTSCFLCGWVTTADSNFPLPRIPASPSYLVAPPILPAWLLANQSFIKNNTSNRLKDHCPTANLSVGDIVWTQVWVWCVEIGLALVANALVWCGMSTVGEAICGVGIMSELSTFCSVLLCVCVCVALGFEPSPHA